MAVLLIFRALQYAGDKRRKGKQQRCFDASDITAL